MRLPGCEHYFYFFAGVFDDIVHVDVNFLDAERVFVGLGYAFYSVAEEGLVSVELGGLI